MTFALQLSERLCARRPQELSPGALYWSKVDVLDTVGVALAGTREDTFRLLDAVIEAQDGGPCLVWGSDRRVSALDAALLNGTSAHALDFDNTIGSLGG